MPQINTITVTKDDGVTTFDLSAISGQQGKSEPAVLRNQTADSYEQGESLTSLLRQSSAVNMRLTLKYRKPIIRSIDGVSTVTRVATAGVDFTVPVDMSAAERKDFMAELVSVLSNSSIQAGVDNLSPLY